MKIERNACAWTCPEGDPALEREIAAALRCSPLLARLLWNRGVRSVQEAERFLQAKLTDLVPPEAFNDMARAVARIRAGLARREKIAVFGDYDADGFLTGNDSDEFDAAYNGGWAHLQQDRKLCGMTPGCNPNKWFGHVEMHSVKSREKWQGYGQSAYDVNRGHVRNTVPLQSRRAKYVEMLGV